jgi:hypothetical protein
MSDSAATVSKNIVWHEGITQAQRDTLTGQKGVTVWFTGLSGEHLSPARERKMGELTSGDFGCNSIWQEYVGVRA